jgi:homoserine kinase
VPLTDAVKQWGNVAGLITGLMTSDFDLIGRSMVDHIVEPVRSVLIPGFDKIKNVIASKGALGSGISGSGPTIFSLSKSESIAQSIGEAVQKEFESFGVGSEAYVSPINQKGASVVSNN